MTVYLHFNCTQKLCHFFGQKERVRSKSSLYFFSTVLVADFLYTKNLNEFLTHDFVKLTIVCSEQLGPVIQNANNQRDIHVYIDST